MDNGFKLFSSCGIKKLKNVNSPLQMYWIVPKLELKGMNIIFVDFIDV